MADLEAQYSALGTHGPLFCDVAYPATGPGVIYDPTGATALSALTSGKEVRALYSRRTCACRTACRPAACMPTGAPPYSQAHLLSQHGSPSLAATTACPYTKLACHDCQTRLVNAGAPLTSCQGAHWGPGATSGLARGALVLGWSI